MPNLTVASLAIPDVLLITPGKIGDHRGYFVETYNAAELAKRGIRLDFVQDNQSLSIEAHTLRGLHFQRPPMAQAKLVRVLKGRIYDVAVDLRKGSPTYGRWCAATITAEVGEQVLIPRGFAHAYCTLEPNTEVAYKVDNYYSRECDAGLLWNDPTIGIVWPFAEADVVLSDKDKALPRFANFDSPFQIGSA